jgi:hypothetical protein
MAILDGGDQISGARGCTPQSCSFKEKFKEKFKEIKNQMLLFTD